MNKKAQALVEFVLILPILIMLIFAFLDIGRIFVSKNELESLSTNIISYIKKDEANMDVNNYLKTLSKDDIKLEISPKGNKYTSIKLSKKLALITPGINLILGNNYQVECERVIINEE